MSEYQQVAVLTCMDIDILEEISRDPNITAEQLRKHIALLHKQKDDAINNPIIRESRFLAASHLYSIYVKS